MINGLDTFDTKLNKGSGLKLVEYKGNGLKLVKGKGCYMKLNKRNQIGKGLKILK